MPASDERLTKRGPDPSHPPKGLRRKRAESPVRTRARKRANTVLTTPKLQDPALTEVLATLRGRLGLERWIATRCEAEELIVVASHGEGLDIEIGDRVRWPESACMASRAAPRAAPDLAGAPPFAGAPLVVQLGLRAYLGAPIWSGSVVLGTLAGLDRQPQGAGLVDAVPFVELCAGLIGRVWEAERAARTDPLTGLWNRRAWDETVTSEEERCRRFGHPAAVLGIDLDDFKHVNDRHGHAAGDEHLRRAAAAIAGSVREHDSVARWGGDEFCVLAVECDELAARRLCARIRDALAAAGVPASIGLALRRREGLLEAVSRAMAGIAEEKAKPREWVVGAFDTDWEQWTPPRQRTERERQSTER